MSDEKPTGPKPSSASGDGGGQRREGVGRGRRRRGRRRSKGDGEHRGESAQRAGAAGQRQGVGGQGVGGQGVGGQGVGGQGVGGQGSEGERSARPAGEGRSRRRRGGRGRGRSRGEGLRGQGPRGQGQRGEGQRGDPRSEGPRGEGPRGEGPREDSERRASSGADGEAPRKRRRRRRRRPDSDDRSQETQSARPADPREGEQPPRVDRSAAAAAPAADDGPLSELDAGWDLDDNELPTRADDGRPAPTRDSADAALPFPDVALREAAAADKAGPVEPDEDLELGEPGAALTDDDSLLDRRLCRLVKVQVSTAPMVELDAGDLEVAAGDQVIVEADRGLALGMVLGAPERRMVSKRPPRVVRKVGDANARLDRAAQREREAYEYCRDRIRSRNMPMKLIRTEFLQSGNKALFYFAAENRVDFRDLVKDLARRLHVRIEMRQIGVRDESRMSAGLGPCGRELCCSSWILDFQPVSIRMAKDQNLVLNPTKVSGMCGRLKCCLAYEQALYKEARKSLPKVGHRVTTPKGNGRVHEIDIPRRIARVLLTDGNIETFKADEVQRQT